MRVRRFWVALVVAALFLSPWVPELAAAGPGVRVTVYHENLGMVAEGRVVDLVAGSREVAFPGVAAGIDPASVQLTSLTAPGSVRVLEQRFEFDLSGTERLLSRYAGRNVLVTTREGGAWEGALLDLQGGDTALRLKDRTVRVIRSGAIDSFLLPGGDPKPVETPTLTFLMEVRQTGAHDLRIHYLTQGMGWNADYVAKVDKEGQRMEVSGWASIENRSGASFEGARVQLVAGSVNRERPPSFQARSMIMAEADSAGKAAAGFQESPFAEYRFYTLPRAATLADRSVTRLPLFSPTEAGVRQEYTYDGARDPDRVNVNLVFANKKSEGLGMPLPAGTFRVYRPAPDGSMAFTGEDRVDHVPEGEDVEIAVGSAFDIKGERTVLETRQIGNRSREETVRITLRNHKDSTVAVRVIERFRGNWSFVGETPPVVKKEAEKVEFQASVPKKGEKTLQYKVLYSW